MYSIQYNSNSYVNNPLSSFNNKYKYQYKQPQFFLKIEYIQSPKKLMENNLLTYSQPSKFLEFKIDFSCIQNSLLDKFNQIQQKLQAIQSANSHVKSKNNDNDLQYGEQISEIIGRLAHLENKQLIHQKNIASLVEKISQICNRTTDKSTTKKTQVLSTALPELNEKTPTQVLNLIDQRISAQCIQKENQIREIQLNSNPPNSDRVCYRVRVREDGLGKNDSHLTLQVIDQKCYKMYAKIMEELDKQITVTRQNLKNQLNQIENIRNSTPSHSRILSGSNGKQNQDMQPEPEKSSRKIISGKLSVRGNRNKKTIIKQQSNDISNQVDITAANSGNKFQDSLREQIAIIVEKIQQIKQDSLKNKDQVSARFEEISSVNSAFADKILDTRKIVEQLTNQVDTLKIQENSSIQKSGALQRQVSLLLENNNDNKSRIKSLENGYMGLKQQVKNIQENQSKNRQNEEQYGSKGVSPTQSKKDLFHDSRSSFRQSVIGNLNNGLKPIRNSSIIKQNNVRLDTTEQNIRAMATKLAALIDRVNRMEDQRKKFGENFSGLFPKIEKQNSKSASTNHFQIIRKDIKKVNEELAKTNEKLNATKEKLNDLYEEHSVIPNKIQDLYIKLRQYNQFQEDRLIQLIKQLINRMLSDPFDNHFTNRLKREINVKFLQIKHEYHTILKQIQCKVEDRAEKSQVVKTYQKFQENMAEIKAINFKKCDVEDFKKGVKYLQNKIKEVYQYAKDQTTILKKQQKQYIGVKKQSFC